MAVLFEFSVVPVGTESPSVSKYVALAVREIEKSGVKHQLTPMGTVFEAKSLAEGFEVISKVHEALFSAGVKRIVTSIKIDDRRDIERDMETKMESAKRALESLKP